VKERRGGLPPDKEVEEPPVGVVPCNDELLRGAVPPSVVIADDADADANVAVVSCGDDMAAADADAGEARGGVRMPGETDVAATSVAAVAAGSGCILA
jgi:hypothetical protein